MRQGLGREARLGLAVVSPPLAFAVLLLALPLLTIILFSFWSQDAQTIIRVFTLENYVEALTDPLYRTLMERSVWVSACVTLATVGLAFPVAYYISFKVRPDRKSLWLFLITIPFWTSYLIRIFLWRVILAFDGPVNGSLIGLGLIEEPLSFLLYNVNAVIITLSHAYAPFAILPIYVSLERIDRSLIEAARDLGESRAMSFLRVTLPLAMPGVLAAVLIVSIPVVGDYVTPRLVGGPSGLLIANMITVQIFDLSNRPLGATLALLAMVTVALCLAWFIMHLRFWAHLAQYVGGGLNGILAALGAAAVDIGILWWVYTQGAGVFGTAGALGVMALIMGGGAALIAWRVPKGAWGI